MVIDGVNAEILMPIVLKNIDRETRVMTDEHYGYRHVGRWFADHGTGQSGPVRTAPLSGPIRHPRSSTATKARAGIVLSWSTNP